MSTRIPGHHTASRRQPFGARGWSCCATLYALSIWLSIGLSVARASPFEVADQAFELESCVSRGRLVMAPGQPRAVLEPADQSPLRQEMMRRYPAVAQDGFAVSRIILWQPARGEALFVTVLDHPLKAGASCFTATFNARRFERFEWLRDRYLRPD